MHVGEEGPRLGSAAATATAREGEKINLLHEGFPKLGAPHTVDNIDSNATRKEYIDIYRLTRYRSGRQRRGALPENEPQCTPLEFAGIIIRDRSYNGLIQTRLIRCKERREVPYDGSGSPEESSELASGDMIGREKILIYYTRDFPN